MRIFEDEASFEFANPAAIMGPNTEVVHRPVDDWLLPLELRPRVAAVIGGRGEIGGFTILADWRAPDLPPPKDRDFALGLGPVVVTPDEAPPPSDGTVRVLGDVVARGSGTFDWAAARDLAAAGTTLKPGDILAGPAFGAVEGIEPGTMVDVEVEGIGVLSQSVHSSVEIQ